GVQRVFAVGLARTSVPAEDVRCAVDPLVLHVLQPPFRERGIAEELPGRGTEHANGYHVRRVAWVEAHDVPIRAYLPELVVDRPRSRVLLGPHPRDLLLCRVVARSLGEHGGAVLGCRVSGFPLSALALPLDR